MTTRFVELSVNEFDESVSFLPVYFVRFPQLNSNMYIHHTHQGHRHKKKQRHTQLENTFNMLGVLRQRVANLRLRILLNGIVHAARWGERHRWQATDNPDEKNDFDGSRERVGELLGVHGVTDVEPALECERENGQDGAHGCCFEDPGAKDAHGGAEDPRVRSD